MTKRRWLFLTALALGALVVTAGVVVARGPGSPSGAPLAQSAVGTGFTYQGRLDEGGSPANGAFDLTFVLFDAAGAGGTQVGGVVALENIDVANGLFTVRLDFGDGVFTGDARWLDIAVRPGSETGAFSPLVPRHEVSPAPYAIHAFSSDSAASAPWSGLTAVPAGFADDTDDDSLASLACAVGQAAVWNGSAWNCIALFGFALSTLDSTGTVGQFTSVTVGSDGLGLISYRDGDNRDLKVAHCADVECTSAMTSTLDSAGDVGEHTSITVGPDGLGLISYLDVTNRDLKVAHCDNVACTSATTSTLDGADDVGEFTSITVGSDGLGLISYIDRTNFDLRVAHCDNVACTSANTTTLDSAGLVFFHTSITVGSDGLGLISYVDLTNFDLKVAHCADVACTSATTSTLDSAGNVGEYTSVTVGSDGLGLVSYFDVTNLDLKVAHCDNVACTSATTSTPDNDVGQYTSMVIGADGLGLVSYFDLFNLDLKVAHCANPVTCIP